METKERNMGEEKSIEQEELLNKKEVLSNEELQEVAGGRPVYVLKSCSQYFEGCSSLGGSREECARECGY